MRIFDYRLRSSDHPHATDLINARQSLYLLLAILLLVICVAAPLGLQYRLVGLELSGMVDALADGEVDAVVAALTITSARDQQVDF